MAKKATTEATDKFIELRAKGISFSKISDELDVSKPILIQWSKNLKAEILNKRAFEIEALHDKYLLCKEKELERLKILLEKVESAIDKADLSQMNLKDMFDVRDKLIIRMNAERTEFKYSEKVTVEPFEIHNTLQSYETIQTLTIV